MELAVEFGRNAQHGYTGWIVVLALLTVFEILNSREQQPLRNRINGITFWAISIPLSAVMLVL